MKTKTQTEKASATPEVRATHTPGPWVTETDGIHIRPVGDSRAVAAVYGLNGYGGKPTLVEALLGNKAMAARLDTRHAQRIDSSHAAHA